MVVIKSGYHFISDEALMELTDSLWTMYSENADDVPMLLAKVPWNHVRGLMKNQR